MPSIDADEAAAGSRTDRRPLAHAALAAAVCGAILMGLNLFGETRSIRSPEIGPSYADFARPTTLPYERALAELEALPAVDTRSLVTEATRIFHYGMAHVPPEDVRSKGVDHYRMRVPAWENWILWGLSYLKPDTYRDYEFCSYRRALERGTGRCGQQSLALVDYLSGRGVETGFINLGGHAVATAKVEDERWFMLDADYGGVIPFDLATAERTPDAILAHYWGPAAGERRLHQLFEPDGNRIYYGGPEARYRRACPIEHAAYVFKWLAPIVLAAPWLWLALRGRRAAPA